MNSISRLGGPIVILLLGMSAYANTQPPPVSSPEAASPQPATEQVSQEIGRVPECKIATSLTSGEAEVCKLQLQRDQYQLEVQKLDDQRRATLLTAIAVVASAIAGFLTIGLN